MKGCVDTRHLIQYIFTYIIKVSFDKRSKDRDNLSGLNF